MHLEAENTGKPHALTASEEMPPMVDQLRFFAGAARVLEGRAAGEYLAGHTSWIRREPIGVVGQVTPWNYPMMMAMWKIAPALAAGNTIVLKPSDTTPETRSCWPRSPRSSFRRARSTWSPATATPVAAVVEHPTPAMVAITGSVRAGCRGRAQCRAPIKRVHLELGGKAPVIVFDDADLEAAVEGIATAGYFNAGQDCTAATRVLAGPGIHGDFVEALADYARTQAVVGMPDNDDALLGPVNNATQLERVTGFIQRLPGHATVSAGGNRLTRLGEGYFLEPTVLSGLRQDDEAVQQEIFGPVITVQQFDDEAQALALGERRGLRPGLLGLDQGLRSRDADVRRAGLRVRLDQHPHPHRRRDAARGLQEVRLRQGPLDVRVRGLHADQARHGQHPELNPHDPTRAERKAPPMTPIPRRGRRPLSPAAAAVAQAAGGGLSRRALLGSGVAASAGLALTGCAPPEPPTGGPAALELPEDLSDSEKTIKWSNWTAYLDVNTKETKSPTLSAFMEQSGIEVSYFEDIDDNDSYYAKVAPQLRAGQSIDRDIFTLTDWMASRVIRDQLCQPVELIQMPNVVQNMLQPLKDASFDPGRNNSITWQSGFAGIGYNRDTVGRELKTLDDLWTDDLKGRIVVLSEFRDTAGAGDAEPGSRHRERLGLGRVRECGRLHRAEDRRGLHPQGEGQLLHGGPHQRQRGRRHHVERRHLRPRPTTPGTPAGRSRSRSRAAPCGRTT